MSVRVWARVRVRVRASAILEGTKRWDMLVPCNLGPAKDDGREGEGSTIVQYENNIKVMYCSHTQNCCSDNTAQPVYIYKKQKSKMPGECILCSLAFAKHHWRYTHKHNDLDGLPQIMSHHTCMYGRIDRTVFARTCVQRRASRLATYMYSAKKIRDGRYVTDGLLNSLWCKDQ